jgi:hypothetical protein
MIAPNTQMELTDTDPNQKTSSDETLAFEAEDVTGTLTVEAKDVSRSAMAGAVAKALAQRMALPPNVPWIIRENRTGSYLNENKPIGDQIQTGDRVSLSPKTHLGGRR